MEPRHSLAGAGHRAHRGAQLGPSEPGKERGKLGGSRRGDCPGLSLCARGRLPAAPGARKRRHPPPGGGDPCYLQAGGGPGAARASGPSFVRRRGPLPLRAPCPAGPPGPADPPRSELWVPGDAVGWGPSWTAPLCSRPWHPDWPAGEGRGEVGRRGGGLPARPRLVRPAGFRSLSGGPALPEPTGPGWPGGADSPRCGSVSPSVRPAPGVHHSLPRSPSSLPGGRLGPSRRAEAGRGRQSSGGGRALSRARAGGCALLSRLGWELGPELAAAVAAAAPSAGPAPAGGSRAPRSAPRLLPAPAPPRQPAPGAPPGRDRASHLPPRPARPLLLEPDSAARVGSTPPPDIPHIYPPLRWNSAGSSGST
ncbi:unnamed protein product [Rangifer tarandus platyrhynchus]|uniref:Uncharacterized protein n=2 Tax=Rangifer tarandus platyrhynchus TaxID=3082113 RepID=A0ACB0E067_RANTA|nr:unnamed protein product [Rangifer tarandus platyrhynchus]CAI9693916.1 unnamed protein product [Rangifer tarandus platyrhynchus]